MTIVGEQPQELLSGAPVAVMDMASKFASGISVDEAAEFSHLINGIGAEAFETCGVLGIFETDFSSDACCSGSLMAYKALALGVDIWIQPYLINLFPAVVSLIKSNDENIKSAAEDAARTVISKLATSTSHTDSLSKLINDLGEDIYTFLSISKTFNSAMTNSGTSIAGLKTFTALSSTAEPWLVDQLFPLYSTVSVFFSNSELKSVASTASSTYLVKLVEAGKSQKNCTAY